MPHTHTGNQPLTYANTHTQTHTHRKPPQTYELRYTFKEMLLPKEMLGSVIF